MYNEPKLTSDEIIDHYTGCENDNDIESIIADAEWWTDTIEENEDIDAFYDYVQFCYRYLPVLLAEIKRLQGKEQP